MANIRIKGFGWRVLAALAAPAVFTHWHLVWLPGISAIVFIGFPLFVAKVTGANAIVCMAIFYLISVIVCYPFVDSIYGSVVGHLEKFRGWLYQIIAFIRKHATYLSGQSRP